MLREEAVHTRNSLVHVYIVHVYSLMHMQFVGHSLKWVYQCFVDIYICQGHMFFPVTD